MNYITNDNLEVADKEVFEIVEAELKRQTNHLEMIASENFTSPAVMQAMGSVFTNKSAPGRLCRIGGRALRKSPI